MRRKQPPSNKSSSQWRSAVICTDWTRYSKRIIALMRKTNAPGASVIRSILILKIHKENIGGKMKPTVTRTFNNLSVNPVNESAKDTDSAPSHAPDARSSTPPLSTITSLRSPSGRQHPLWAQQYKNENLCSPETGVSPRLPDSRERKEANIGIRGERAAPLAESSDKNHPRVNVADKFSVRHLPKNIEFSYEADETKHYLYAYVDKNNQLSFSIRAQGDRKRHGSGRDMFMSLMNRITKEKITIEQIQAHWATDDDSVNTKKYLENLSQGMSNKEAAINTWTGRLLGEYGFHPQIFRTSEDKTSIYVLFKKEPSV